MTNPTKGQTPTAEELRKMLESIPSILKNDPKVKINGRSPLTDIRILSEGTYQKILTYLKSQESSPASLPPALTWEQALDNAARDQLYSRNTMHEINLGAEPRFCRTWDDFLETNPKASFIAIKTKQAAHLFMEANRQQRWIPVEERLPPIGQKILFATKNHVYMGSYRWVFGNKEFVDSAICCVGVVAWQPLPEVPK